jgi:hypothetical protein
VPSNGRCSRRLANSERTSRKAIIGFDSCPSFPYTMTAFCLVSARKSEG